MAITTTLYYPSAYLPGPLKESFGLTPVSPLKRTQMVTGRARQRRAYTSTPTQTDLAWIFSDAQAQAFEAWFRDELSDGAAGSERGAECAAGTGRVGAAGRDNFYSFIIIIVSSSRNLEFCVASAAVMRVAALGTRCRPALSPLAGPQQGWEPRARAETQTFLYCRF